MKKWDVQLSEPAENDLIDIYRYIAVTLLEPAIAWRQIERIRNAVYSLDQMPERGSLFPNEPWRSRGLRRLFTGNYCILYEIDDETDTVNIIAILYSKRNIDEVLTQDDR
ncbi:MAG: type II toxin-antitoxin system RelE/ParE family toxin [Oscillospiraceae bacterium]|nr:type II toxin-antitoxin system RelE/ParE family toxin [Oscillospiraceae bacterium]